MDVDFEKWFRPSLHAKQNLMNEKIHLICTERTWGTELVDSFPSLSVCQRPIPDFLSWMRNYHVLVWGDSSHFPWDSLVLPQNAGYRYAISLVPTPRVRYFLWKCTYHGSHPAMELILYGLQKATLLNAQFSKPFIQPMCAQLKIWRMLCPSWSASAWIRTGNQRMM